MRSVCSCPCGWAGSLWVVILLPLLGTTPASAKKQPHQRHPLVLPRQSLPYIQQLNAGTSFSLVCLSQTSVPGTTGAAQTAVLDLSPPAGAVSSTGSFPLFMFPQDVPVVQQLNGGMGIQTTAIIPVTDVTGKTTQVAQVSVSGPGQSQNQTGQAGCLIVCPIPSLPLVQQLNPDLSMKVLCTSQSGAGKGNPASQTVLLDLQPTHGIVDPSQPLPMLVPVSLLPTLGQLNSGSIIDVTEVRMAPFGSNAVLLVALINVTQNEQPLASSNTGNADNSDDQGEDENSQGKGNGKGHGKGHDKEHGKDD